MTIGFRGTANAPNGGASVTIAVPTGTVNGDVMIAGIWRTGTTGNTPAGWTLLRSGIFNVSTNSFWVYRRIASGEPANYTFDGGTSTFTFGFIDSFSGVSNVAPEAGATPASVDNITSGTIAWPTIVTDTPNAWHLALVADNNTIADISGPTGYTVRGIGPVNTKASQDTTREIPDAGPVSVTATYTANSATAISVALRAAGAEWPNVAMDAPLEVVSLQGPPPGSDWSGYPDYLAMRFTHRFTDYYARAPVSSAPAPTAAQPQPRSAIVAANAAPPVHVQPEIIWTQPPVAAPPPAAQPQIDPVAWTASVISDRALLRGPQPAVPGLPAGAQPQPVNWMQGVTPDRAVLRGPQPPVGAPFIAGQPVPPAWVPERGGRAEQAIVGGPQPPVPAPPAGPQPQIDPGAWMASVIADFQFAVLWPQPRVPLGIVAAQPSARAALADQQPAPPVDRPIVAVPQPSVAAPPTASQPQPPADAWLASVIADFQFAVIWPQPRIPAPPSAGQPLPSNWTQGVVSDIVVARGPQPAVGAPQVGAQPPAEVALIQSGEGSRIPPSVPQPVVGAPPAGGQPGPRGALMASVISDFQFLSVWPQPRIPAPPAGTQPMPENWAQGIVPDFPVTRGPQPPAPAQFVAAQPPAEVALIQSGESIRIAPATPQPSVGPAAVGRQPLAPAAPVQSQEGIRIAPPTPQPVTGAGRPGSQPLVYIAAWTPPPLISPDIPLPTVFQRGVAAPGVGPQAYPTAARWRPADDFNFTAWPQPALPMGRTATQPTPESAWQAGVDATRANGWPQPRVAAAPPGPQPLVYIASWTPPSDFPLPSVFQRGVGAPPLGVGAPPDIAPDVDSGTTLARIAFVDLRQTILDLGPLSRQPRLPVATTPAVGQPAAAFVMPNPVRWSPPVGAPGASTQTTRTTAGWAPRPLALPRPNAPFQWGVIAARAAQQPRSLPWLATVAPAEEQIIGGEFGSRAVYARILAERRRKRRRDQTALAMLGMPMREEDRLI